MPKQNQYLVLENISKSFGSFHALRDINLTIAEGEFVCFLGPSGCGKTTLLRIIAGLESQDRGQISQGGKDISWLPPIKRDYGIVFQSYALFPNLSIAENVAYGLVNHGKSRTDIRARVTELLALAGLQSSGDKYPGQLSGGQQQRIALARALATSPGLLLLDEPLSALDAMERVRLRGEIRQLQQRLGVTTIMVTHDQEEALTMADRIVVMNNGKIEQIGTPQQVYLQPGSPFVAAFVGKVNILQGISLGDGRFRIGQLDFLSESRVDHIPAGDPVKVYLRPEDFVVRDAETRTANRAMGEVLKIEFLGAFSYLTVALAGMEQQPVIASMSLNLLKELKLTVGSKVLYGLLPERIRVYCQHEQAPATSLALAEAA